MPCKFGVATMKTPNDHARWLFTLVACELLIPACAAAYSAQLRWNAPTDPAVAGYHLYVRDGVERLRGTDPLDATSPSCDALPFSDFGFGRSGIADVEWDATVDDMVVHATATARNPLRFRASYPAHGTMSIYGDVLATAVRSAQRFRIEVTVRST